MNTLTLEAKRFVRPILLTIALYVSLIMIASITMIKPAQASGNLSTPPSMQYSVSVWQTAINTTPGSLYPVFVYTDTPLPCSAPSVVELKACVKGAVGTDYISTYWGNFVGSCPGTASCFSDVIAYKLGCSPANSQLAGTACSCIDPYVPDPAKTSCVEQQYKLSLTPDTATIEPGKTYTFTATVTDQDGIPPIEDVPVTVKVEVDPTSGGHDHGDSSTRPKGSVSPSSGNTSFTITFGATEVSGTHTITATCDLCSNSPLTATVNVKVKELTSLTASSDYEFVGGETGKAHTDNHWLTATAKENLLKIVKRYNTAYPDGPLLRLNDASLIWGGKFDIHKLWEKDSDHTEHRRGEAIDIRANQLDTAIPESRFEKFRKIAGKNGASADLHCNPPYSRTCPGCILDTGNNRHFHVYLLGK